MAYSPSLWLMAIGWWNKINQSKIETKSDTNLRSLYESWFRNALHHAEHLGNNIEGHNSFMKAIERKDVEAANNYLRAMIISAACLVWITKAFNLERLLNLWERGKPQNKPSKKRAGTQLENANLTDTRRSRQKHIKSVDVGSPK
jgi:hypothetical protein